MSYDIYRIFVDGAIEPSEEEIKLIFGGTCVPRFSDHPTDCVRLYADAIIFSVRRLGKVYNVLYWKTWDDDGKPKSWDCSIFSPVPPVFRWRTDAYPIRFKSVIKPDAVHHAALQLYMKLAWMKPELLTKEDISTCFYTQADVAEILSD